MVPRRHPDTLLHHPPDILIDLWLSLDDLRHSRLLPWPSTFDIAQCLLQTPQLHLHLILSLLCILHRNGLEALNGLDLLTNIVRLRLECLVVLLDLVDHGGVLQDLSVVAEVDLGGMLGEDLHAAAGVVVSLFESCKGGGSRAAEAELLRESAPVEL